MGEVGGLGGKLTVLVFPANEGFVNKVRGSVKHVDGRCGS